MDGVAISEETEREIADLMAEFGFDRETAMIVLGVLPGAEVFGDGDLVCIRPLTEEQRRQLGLGRSLEEVLAEQRARQAREADGVRVGSKKSS